MNLKNYLKSKPVLANLLFAILSLLVFAFLSLQFLKIYTHHKQSIAVPSYKGLSHKEYVQVTKKSKLRYEIIDSMYVADAKPGSVIEQYPAPGYKVKQRRTIFLTIASLTPEKVAVPKLVDVGLREAQSRLENVGLKVGNVIYRPSEFKNLVLEQRYQNRPIPKGELIPEGTAIDLIVGKGLSNEKTELPTLIGLTLDDALTVLYTNNLNIGALVYDSTIVTSYDSLNARVWKQLPDPAENNAVELGTSIDIFLTTNESKWNQISAEDTLYDESGDF